MPPEAITGRDIELITVGTACFFAAGWFGLLGQPLNLRALAIFLFLGGLSFALAWWDIQSRDGRFFPPE